MLINKLIELENNKIISVINYKLGPIKFSGLKGML